jgi:hypothetical protein
MEAVMDKANLQVDIGRTLGVGLGLWIGAVAAGAATGVFERLDSAERVALIVFGTIFALAAYRLDHDLGRFVRAARRLGLATLVFDTAALIGLAGGSEAILLASLPLALAAHLALYDRARRSPAVRSAAAKSPGAHPAAT